MPHAKPNTSNIDKYNNKNTLKIPVSPKSNHSFLLPMSTFPFFLVKFHQQPFELFENTNGQTHVAKT